ncbi:MAG: glycosyltransferase family 2 protein [Methanobacterium sp.]
MNDPSVDVVIITYNQENFINDTINSVIKQSYENIGKIIVSDDGSTDKTPSIIETYVSNNSLIEPVLAKNNKGIAYNINRALKRVDGDYISILGGDDLMLQQKIEKQVNYFNINPDVVACVHDMDVFDSFTGKSLGKFSEVMSFKKIKDKVGVESLFDPAICHCDSSVMYRAEKISEIGFDERLKFRNDFLFDVEVLMKGKLGFIDEILGRYRIHGDNVTLSDEVKKFGLEDSLIAYSIIIARYPELHSLVNKRRNATYMANILECVRNGNSDRAKNLSKVLMSEGSYIKGLGAYLLSSIFNKERVDKLYQNKRLLKFFVKHF